jgi:hypothetical protein
MNWPFQLLTRRGLRLGVLVVGAAGGARIASLATDMGAKRPFKLTHDRGRS